MRPMFRADMIFNGNIQAEFSDVFHKNIPGGGDVLTKGSVKIEQDSFEAIGWSQMNLWFGELSANV